MTWQEEATASRKTPFDGKLEVSATAADRLRSLTGTLSITVGKDTGPGRVESMECVCAKSGSARHMHHFIVGPVLQALSSGASVILRLDESSKTIDVSPTIGGG